MNNESLTIPGSPVLPGLALPERTVPTLLDRSRRFGEDRVFLVDIATRSELTYREFLERVSGAASSLHEGFAPGSRIAVMLSNRIEYVILRFALSLAGLVEVALNGVHKGAILNSMLEIGEPHAVIVEDRFRGNLEGCRYPIAPECILDESRLVSITSQRVAWDDRPCPPLHPSTPCRVVFTSGTTGGTKGAELSHGYEVFSGDRYARTLDVRRDDRWLHVTPFFHIDAIVEIAALLHFGGAFVLAPRFSASRFWQEAAATGATAFWYSGTILAVLLRGQGPSSATPIRMAFGGNASGAVCERFESQFGIPAIEIYGMTECLTATANTRRRRGSVGEHFDGYEIAVVDEFDRVLEPGKRGEITIRALEPWGMMSLYRNDPAATAESVRNFWFHTGDLGSFDGDGFMYCHGRIRDVIRRRGENITASELEAVVEEHPAVVRAAAVGVASDLGEEEVLLYAQLDPASHTTPDEIKSFIVDRVAPFMVPLYVRIVDALPLSTTEKVKKSELSRDPFAPTWVNSDAS